MRSYRKALPSTVLLLVPFLVAPAQEQETTGSIVVTVRSADSATPLKGALIFVEGGGFVGVTDGSGSARLTGMAPGFRVVETRILGYSRGRAEVAVRATRTAAVEFDLAVDPIEVAQVVVRARPSARTRNGFTGREQRGMGTYVTREEIEALNPRFLSEVLRRVAGISLQPNQLGGSARLAIRGNPNQRCPVQYFVDGTKTAFFNIDDVRPQDVEGLEIYRGAASVPIRFNVGNASCGVILIWTRRE